MNGEMEDKCKQCGISLIPILDASMSDDMDVHEGGRKLKAHGSHGDAPARKTLNATETDIDMKDMMKDMFEMMKSVKVDVSSLKSEVHEVKEGMGKLGTKVDEATAMAKDAKEAAGKASHDVTFIRDDVAKLKDDVKQLEGTCATKEEVLKMIAESASQQPKELPRDIPASLFLAGFSPGGSGEEEVTWLENEMKRMKQEMPIDIYLKDDELK